MNASTGQVASNSPSSSPSPSSEKLSNLFKDFNREDIDKIVTVLLRLKEEMGEASQGAIVVREQREVLPSRKTRWVKNITPEQNKKKQSQEIFIADSFIKYGINYHYITQTYPDMSPKIYRCYVEGINNNAVNDIIAFLRYECNVEIERMNRDQKRSIRTQLTKIKDWLGNRDMDQLECFYKFIRRHYNKKSVQIVMDDAVRLYKTILSIIKSPSVNVFEEAAAVENGENDETMVCGLKKEEANTLIILFIKWKDLTKVTDLMCQKYGYEVRLSSHSIRKSLRLLLDASVDKLISNLKSKERELYINCFTPKNRELLQNINDIDMKITMYSYYMEKRNNYVKVRNLVNKLREFFERYNSDTTIDVSLAKVEQTKTEDGVKQEDVSAFDITRTVCPNESMQEGLETGSESELESDMEEKCKSETKTK